MSLSRAFSMPGVALALSLTLVTPACKSSPPPPPTATPPPPVTPVVPIGTADELFDSNTLQDLHLSIRPDDLATLRAHYGDNTFYPADLTWTWKGRDVVLRNVAIRSRGHGSRDPNKIGLLVDMNRDTPGQTLVGLKSLVLDNLRQDPAMMREFLAMSTFSRMGQPAPRAAYCRLYLNNVYEGLYVMLENIDKDFIGRSFGRDDGYLFEYQWQQRLFGEYLGNDLALYRTLFDAKTHSGESDGILYDPIRAMFEAINAPEEVKGRADLEAVIDLAQFVKFLAIEKTMTDQDGFAGFFGMNNFYLYRDVGSKRHSFLVWDRDRSLTPELVSVSIFYDVDTNAFARRALSYDDLHALYVTVAGDTAKSLSGWLSSEIDRIWTLVSTAAHADTHKGTNAEFDEAVAQLRQVAIDRPAIVLNEIRAIPADVSRVR